MRIANPRLRSKQRGVVLVTAMLLLIVVTILGLSMFHSFGTQEKIAGNTREKQRALTAAVSAQQYAEYWLTSGLTPATGICNPGMISATIGQICINAPADFTAVPWTAGVHYTPFTLNPLNTISQVNPTPGSYFDLPAFYITDLGTYGTGELYQIDAVGYGGTPNAVSVVESTYVITQSGAQSPNI
jgi:type IV pilus assembly protein PilX